MVLMSLFSGSKAKADIENRLLDTEGKKRVGQIERAAWKSILLYVNRHPVRICCMTEGAQTGAL